MEKEKSNRYSDLLLPFIFFFVFNKITYKKTNTECIITDTENQSNIKLL